MLRPSSTLASFFASGLVLLAVDSVLAHVGIWHPSVYGYNASGREQEHWYDEPINTNFIKNPLRLDDNLSFDEWFFHGLRGAKPDAIMELPAGGDVTIQTSCNKAFTTYGVVPEQLAMVGDLPCDINLKDGVATYGDPNVAASNGPLHVADISDAKGCALAIAYTNDVYSIKPEDFTVFSVQHECVWKRETVFEIPADLPPCPNGKCICSWNWMHGGSRGEGYSNELYMVGFDCNVVNSNNSASISTPKVPVECRDESSKCVTGAKQPLYWEGAQADGWNIANYDGMLPPSYNAEWGFANGAQNDIFTISSASSASSSTASTETKTASSTVKANAASSQASLIVSRTGLQKDADMTIYSTRTNIVYVTADAKKEKRRNSATNKRRMDAHEVIGGAGAHRRSRK